MDDLEERLTLWELKLRHERKTPATLRTYLRGVRAFARWCAATGTPLAFDRPTVSAFTADTLAAGAQPATARVCHQSVRRFAAFCAAEDGVPDPLAGMTQPKLDVKVVPKLTDAELAALIRACEGRGFRDRRDEAIVRLFSEGACRAGELLAMTAGDVDLSRGTAIVRRGKGGTGRMFPFGPQAGLALGRYLRLRRAHPLAATPALWLGERGRGLNYWGLYSAMQRRAQAAGIAGFHVHRLRHTAASRWLAAGGSEGGLMAIAGWKSRAMLDRYVADSAMERAAEEARGLNLGDL
jgi:integrase/recombinase XerD